MFFDPSPLFARPRGFTIEHVAVRTDRRPCDLHAAFRQLSCDDRAERRSDTSDPRNRSVARANAFRSRDKIQRVQTVVSEALGSRERQSVWGVNSLQNRQQLWLRRGRRQQLRGERFTELRGQRRVRVIRVRQRALQLAGRDERRDYRVPRIAEIAEISCDPAR